MVLITDKTSQHPRKAGHSWSSDETSINRTYAKSPQQGLSRDFEQHAASLRNGFA